MVVLGWIFLVVLAVVVLTALMLAFLSFPDMRRYRSLRRM